MTNDVDAKRVAPETSPSLGDIIDLAERLGAFETALGDLAAATRVAARAPTPSSIALDDFERQVGRAQFTLRNAGVIDATDLRVNFNKPVEVISGGAFAGWELSSENTVALYNGTVATGAATTIDVRFKGAGPIKASNWYFTTTKGKQIAGTGGKRTLPDGHPDKED